MPTDDLLSSTSAECKEVVYTINSYEDTRSTINNKSASHDPADYIQKARVTRAVPPKPAYDPLQFVQLKPCSLVKTAQEQVKKAENVKKVNEEKKEEPEEWQCNLDNWKSSRRKRVEHIIDRVVEVKKLELEEHDRNRRKSKTFNEMMEERGSRRLKHLPIYVEDDNDALGELGLGISDTSTQITKNETESKESLNNNLPPIEPESNEYTYEGAIENYKSRVSRTAGYLQSGLTSDSDPQLNKPSPIKCAPEKVNDASLTLTQDEEGKVSKIDFMKRKELFEKEQFGSNSESEPGRASAECVKTMTVKERLSILELCHEPNNKTNHSTRVPANVSFTDLKNRLEVFEREIKNVSDTVQNTVKASSSSTGGCSSNVRSVTTEQNVNSNSKATKDTQISNEKPIFDHNVYAIFAQNQTSETDENENLDTDREDSGIHTTDVSCSVSQADDQNDEPEQQIDNSKDERCDGAFALKGESQVLAGTDYANDISILDDALEMAFQEIDNQEGSTPHTTVSCATEPIYQNLNEIEEASKKNAPHKSADDVFEPYYQVPQSQEPYYEVPKTKRVPLYENVILNSSSANDGCEDRSHFTFDFGNKMQPPKEKPPPPPIDTALDDECDKEVKGEKDNFQRINSITRIRKEISCKRSSFLGIDDKIQEIESIPLSEASMTTVHKGRQIYEQYADNHLRENINTVLNCDMSTLNNFFDQDSDSLITACAGTLKDLNNPKESPSTDYEQFGCYYQHAGQSVKQDAVLSSNFHIESELSRKDIQREQENTNITPSPHEVLQTKKELRSFVQSHTPPAKPLRSSHFLQQNYNPLGEHRNSLSNIPYADYSQQLRFAASSLGENPIEHCNRISNSNLSTEDVSQLSDKMRLYAGTHSADKLVAAPKIDPLSMWSLKYNAPPFELDTADPPYPLHSNMLRQRSYTECSPQWNKRAMAHKANKNTSTDSYSRHWFVQEAEQRRIEQQQQQQLNAHNAGSPSRSSNRKSLPESVIQTITQRVQNLGIGTERRWQTENPTSVTRLSAAENKAMSPSSSNMQVSQNHNENDDKVLSVSGKKKCSHCNLELGRGAAMVIESLGLLYHIDCFKCCVCHARLGDGFKGTDVRVRKYKLHCQNCFSSEDGVKFSCV